MSDQQEKQVAAKVYATNQIIKSTKNFLLDKENTTLEKMAQIVLASRQIEALKAIDWDKYFEEEENDV